jgi:hypothetical protein
MKIMCTALVVCLATLSTTFAYAASAGISALPVVSPTDPRGPVAVVFGVPGSGSYSSSTPADDSSSSAFPDAPDADATAGSKAGEIRFGLARNSHLRLHTDAFSAIAVGVTTGIEGIGFQVATPLATKINLRGGVSFLNFNPTFTALDTQINGVIKFRTVNAGIDFYPYRNSFHITPGFTFYNGNHVAANVNMVGGQTFDIADTTYTSSPTDPVTGTFDMYLGRKFAPSITVGFGNMLRRDSHWSIPTEIGIEYIGAPTATLNIRGTACSPVDGCTQVQTDASTQANIVQEQNDLNKDISLLRFYPILSVGVSYRFGHNKQMSLWR